MNNVKVKQMNKSTTLSLNLHFLHEEIRTIESRIGPHDCGHLKTAVSVLRSRVEEVLAEITKSNGE